MSIIKILSFLFIFTIVNLNAMDKVSLQLLWKHQFEFAGFYIAKEKGYYKDVGLDVEIKEYDFGMDIVHDVLSGKNEFAIGRSSLVLDKLKGKDISLLFALYQSSPYVLLSKKRDDLKTINDFKNKKIMLSDNLESIAAIFAMMKIKNIKSNDYKELPHSFNIDDIVNDKVDLMTTYLSNEPYHLMEKEIEFTIFNPKDYGFNFYADLVFTSQKYLETNQENTNKFIQASKKGWTYAFENINETIDLVYKHYNTQNKSKESLKYEAVILKELAYQQNVEFGNIDELRVKEIANLYKLLGMSIESNDKLHSVIYKEHTFLEFVKSIFTFQFLLIITSIILIIIFLSIYKHYILRKQNTLLQESKKLAEIAEKKYRNLYELSEDPMLIMIDGEFVHANNSALNILQYTSIDELQKVKFETLSPEFQDNHIPSSFKVNEMVQIAMGKGYHRFEWTHKKKNGDLFPVEISLTKIPYNDTTALFCIWRDITEKKQAEQTLLNLKNKFETIFKTSIDGIAILDLETNFLEFNDAYLDLTGYTRDELLKKSCIGMSRPEDQPKAKQALEEVMKKGFIKNFEKSCVKKDGSLITINMSISFMPDKNRIIVTSKDITEQKQKDKKLREKLQKFIDTQSSLVILTDSKKIKFANKQFLDFFGYESLEESTESFTCICERFLEHDHFFHLGKVKEDEKNWIESLLNLSGRARIVSIINKYAVPYAFSISINQYENEDYVVSFTDISDTMIEKIELTKEATIDSLTNVYNRTYFNKHIEQIIQTHQNENTKTGIIFFDIDHFKKINDTYGHDIGDIILSKLSSIVKKHVRMEDKIIRWGGEEFLIISPMENLENLSHKAEDLRVMISEYEFPSTDSVTCSFGCAIHDSEKNIIDTIKIADEKLYIAKENGRNRVEF